MVVVVVVVVGNKHFGGNPNSSWFGGHTHLLVLPFRVKPKSLLHLQRPSSHFSLLPQSLLLLHLAPKTDIDQSQLVEIDLNKKLLHKQKTRSHGSIYVLDVDTVSKLHLDTTA